MEDKRILIIGAGVAGLSCAAKLKEYGCRNVKILEARDRIGGRIHTIDYGPHILELGAQWIHGKNSNAIYTLAKQNDEVDEKAPDYIKVLLSFLNLDSKEEREAVINTVDFLDAKVNALSVKNEKKKPHLIQLPSESSLLSYLSKSFNSYVIAKRKSSSCIKQLMKEAFNWYVLLQCEMCGCEDLKYVSAGLLHCYDDCDGHETIELKKGYRSVIALILKKIPQEWLHLQKNVMWIEYGDLVSFVNSTSTMSIPCKIKSVDGSEYCGDHVIITIPLGCLKTANKMFSPPLPLLQQKAIECIGFDAVNKIFLKFEEPFWKSPFIFNCICMGDNGDGQISTDENVPKGEEPWYRNINRFAYVPNQPNILCAWVVCKGAKVMETLSDEQIIADCHKLLQTILGLKDVPKALKVIRSDWKSDPFSQGSYSYLSVLCEEKKVSHLHLSEPVVHQSKCGNHPLLQFAGEATHPIYFSTVHGAYDTGIREADRLFHHYQQNPVDHHLKDIRTARVIIIGAGTAGLACAQQLLRLEIPDVIILEAQDRIGGRIFTVPFEDSVLELGAQWIHGEVSNPLYEHCREHNLLGRRNIDVSHEGTGLFCTSEGKLIDTEIVDEVISLMENIKGAINPFTYQHAKEPLSMSDVFNDGFEKYLASCDDSPKIRRVKKGLFEWFLRFEVIDNACNLQDLTTLGYAAWVDCPGRFHNNFIHGFDSFIYTISNQIPPEQLLTSKPVKCIHWHKTFSAYKEVHHSKLPVLVECADGEHFAAQHVIVTSSVGFIQSKLHDFFSPPLPENKKRAFLSHGYGTVNKIFLVFEKPFWVDELGFQLIWLDNVDVLKQFSSEETSWVFGISGFDPVIRQPSVLVGWIGGQYAIQMEEVSDEMVGQTCAQLLRCFLKRDNIPDPVKVIRSCWNSNDFMKGSYSCRTKQFYDARCCLSDIREPLLCEYTTFTGEVVEWPLVLFAGEAMDPEYFSSVHGALRSGESEATRLKRFISTVDKF